MASDNLHAPRERCQGAERVQLWPIILIGRLLRKGTEAHLGRTCSEPDTRSRFDRGTNHAGWPNYKEHKLLTASELFESYAVIFVDNGSTTVQMVEFGYSGPIRVEASPDYEAWDRETMVR